MSDGNKYSDGERNRIDYAAKFEEAQIEAAPDDSAMTEKVVETVPDPVPLVELEVKVAESRNLNVRSLPSTDSDIVTTLPRAAVVTLVEEVDDVWYGVSTADGTLGYVMRKFVAELPVAYPGR